MHIAEKARLATAEYPRRPNDISSRASHDRSSLASDFGSTIDVDRLRCVFDRVRRPANGFTREGVLRTEMNELRARFSRRFSEKARAIHVYRSRSLRVLFAIVNLQHRAIEDQRRLYKPDATVDPDCIGDIEIGVFKRHDFMVASHSNGEVAGHKPGSSRYQHFHGEEV